MTAPDYVLGMEFQSGNLALVQIRRVAGMGIATEWSFRQHPTDEDMKESEATIQGIFLQLFGTKGVLASALSSDAETTGRARAVLMPESNN